MTLPVANQGTAATALSANAGGYLAQPAINTLNDITQSANIASQNYEKAQQDAGTNVKSLIEQMTNRPGDLANQYNIQGLSADAMKAKSNYDSVELGYRRQKEAVTVNGALSAEQKAATISEIERKEATQKADIAIDYNLKAGLLSNAKELMNDQIKLELEPMKLKVDYYNSLKNDYKDVFTTAQNRQVDFLAKKEDRAYQASKDAAQNVQSLKLAAIKEGVSWEDAKGIRSIDDYGRLVGTKGIAAATPLLPSGKPDVVGELTNVLRVSKEDVPSASKAIGVLAGLQKLATANPEGDFIGIAKIIKPTIYNEDGTVKRRGTTNLRSGTKRAEFSNNQADVVAIEGAVQSWLTGASVGADQRAFVKSMVPLVSDSDFIAKTKINNLTEYMQSQAKADLAAKGINYQPTKIDYFATPVQNYVNNAVEQATDPYEQYYMQVMNTQK